jgi:hypothetical protein
MAALMITGAKIGALIGRKRAFAIGCIITFLEGVGVALILPAIVALVAGNFATERRPAA